VRGRLLLLGVPNVVATKHSHVETAAHVSGHAAAIHAHQVWPSKRARHPASDIDARLVALLALEHFSLDELSAILPLRIATPNLDGAQECPGGDFMGALDLDPGAGGIL